MTLLTWIIFLPTFGALFIAFMRKGSDEAQRIIALAVTAVTLVLTIMLWKEFNPQDPGIQPVFEVTAIGEGTNQVSLTQLQGYTVNENGQVLIGERVVEKVQRGADKAWIENWNIFYRLGYDGISFPLVLLTSFICFLSMLASWSITKNVKGYLILFLLLETGMLGVFLALDFFLFYVFWEVMLLPMYFLIGVWGGPRKEYAAIKFFLYTLAGSILILIALLMFYFKSGNNFNLMDLAELARQGGTFSQSMQITAFILLFIGFAIKVPTFPFHTWLPDAHVEAPTPISMILAGVLLKMGGYGILRIAFPLCPYGAQYAAYALVVIGAFSIIYGAFAAMAQTDFKRLVAYSSVSHMGYVLLGIAVWKITDVGGAVVGKNYWLMGMNGAMFQMLAHGVSSAGMFFMVGVIYDRVHHRDLNQFGGLAGLMPLYTGLAAGIFFAGLGLPGLCGFIGEVFVVLSSWNYSPLLAIIAASGVILTAGYILWALQRVYLGPEYKGPHREAITEMNGRETAIAGIILVAAIILGVAPFTMFDLMNASMSQLVTTLDEGYRATVSVLSGAELNTMNFNDLLQQLVSDTTGKSLRLFTPELALCATIVLLLLARIFTGKRIISAGWLALLGTLTGLFFAGCQFVEIHEPGAPVSETFFTGLLIYDKFTVFFRAFLLLFLVLVIVLTMLSGIPDAEDGPDFYTLLLGSTIGMMLMASANHLLMLFFGIEMTSVPSYVMVGFLKGRRLSSEASLKYVVYGAGAAGVMLYGISLLAGLLGTGDLSAIASQLQMVFGHGGDAATAGMASSAVVRTIMLAILLVLVGLAFKLSVVPFHFWCPDAFEGAPAEVAGFLSVASKAGAFALLVRFVLKFTGLEAEPATAIPLTLGIGLGVVAIVTATYGNLTAYAQTNIKRLLAYSTIAHAGYMLMAVAAMLVILSPAGAATLAKHPDAARKCLEGLLYYLCVYFFMNLGAFAIVALIRNHIFSEEIEDYGGLVHQSPVLCVCMLICMFSLVGIPPFGGFVGKLMIFNSLVVAANVHWFMWVVLAIGGLNTVFSLFYYLRVLKAMFIEPRPEGARPVRVPWASPTGSFALVVSVPALLLGFVVSLLNNVTVDVASVFFP